MTQNDCPGSSNLVTNDTELLQRTQQLLGICSNTNNNDILITKTVDGTTEMDIPCCSNDVKQLSKSVNIKAEKASLEVKKKAVKNQKFTKEEDAYLKAGIAKYGRKNWANILRDDQFQFHSSRNRDSLRMRAESAAFKRLFSSI